MLKNYCSVAVAVCALLFVTTPSALMASTLPPRPKLVVLLVIDQFRADYLLRFEKRFLPATAKNGQLGGFQYLMSHGAYYPMAEYGILQSKTCPGHATVLTGAYPYQSGIPVNAWNDPATGRFVYCAEDPAHTTVGAPGSEHIGTSPKNLIATTVGDELKNAGYPSRVVSLALKDRAAIMMGGHRADLAFWMNAKTQSWVSSTFYLPDGKLPEWLLKLNQEIKKGQPASLTWEAEGEGSGFSEENAHPPVNTGHIGPRFPHAAAGTDHEILALPYGLELTETAAERALDAFKLGRGAATDLLAVSFSSHDYIGHAFGPNSREMEEMTIHEDLVLSKFFNHLRKTLPGGLKDVVLVLTGDHGAPPEPSWAKAHGIDAGTINEDALSKDLEKLLSDKFGNPGSEKWISYNHDFDVFVNRKAIAARKTDLTSVLNQIKAHLLTIHGVAQAYTLTEFQDHKFPPGLIGEQTAHSYYPGRSGDIIITPLPYYMTEDSDAVSHLTGYSYDRMVPLILAGPRIKPGNYASYARIIDLAPTLSYLTGVLPPSLSEGRVLSEALVQGAAH